MASIEEPAQIETPPVSPTSSGPQSDAQNDTENGTQEDTQNPRRSGRAKKAPTKYDEEHVIPAYEAPSQPETGPARPKRKAAQAAAESIVLENTDHLLEEILSRMSPDERKEYAGWAEVESEPDFFNAMLHDLGVRDVRVQELYALEPVFLENLAQPVHGLVFLFEYGGDEEPNRTESRQECPRRLWFANQTTANGCATVALMNIIMNAPGIKLGDQIQEFKDSTMGLSPPHRGYFLDGNDFVRSVHNSVARRIDLVAEDLGLDNKYEESLKKKRASKKGARPARRKANAETNYHYIAYVPIGGQVWELDGLQTMPLRLGPVGSSWLDVAKAAIQERMSRNSEFSSYSLLALCHSFHGALVEKFATSLACSRALHELFSGNPTWTIPDPFRSFPETRLARLNLTHETVAALGTPDFFMRQMSQPDFGAQEALKQAEQMRTEEEYIEAQCISEKATVEDAVGMIRDRRRDYTPAIHEWVRVLAEKGVLRELIQETGQKA